MRPVSNHVAPITGAPLDHESGPAVRVSARRVGLSLFLVAFAAFALTSSDRLTGYEPETVAVTEGFVRTGVMQVLPDSPLRSSGHLGVDGRLYGRTTFVQPLLEAPLMFVGYHLDAATSSGTSTRFRQYVAWLYSPVMAAFAVLAFFAVVLSRLGSIRNAVGTALLFAFASIAWPYSKIGMETTFMALLLGAVWATLRAHDRRTTASWAIAGLLAGATVASKPYAGVAVLPLGLVLIASMRGWPTAERVRHIIAAVAPVIAFALLMAGHNKLRHGSWTDFGSAERLSPTLAAPLNWIGLFLAPGKGLLLYSPLVLLGLLGLREVLRSDRMLAICIVGPVLALTSVIAVSAHWSDETWGPRYIVPAAGLLLLPIAWWATTDGRRRLRNGLTAVAVTSAVLGVVVPYASWYRAAPSLTGVSLFQQRTSSADGTDISDSEQSVPYGRDGMRWIPQLSPLLFHAEMLGSAAAEAVTGQGVTVTYAPFEGRRTSLDLTGIGRRLDVRVPDVFWLRGYTWDLLGAVALLTLLLASSAYLRRALKRLRTPALPEASTALDTAAPPPS